VKLSSVFILILGATSAFSFTHIPKATATHSSEMVAHERYLLSYNEQHEVSNWALANLNPNMMRNCANRSNSFRPDPSISTGSATLADYDHSGYDRGHLVPAGDMKVTKRAMSESFYLSNMTPQTAHFNRGQWQTLEVLLRAWVMKGTNTTIITGPVLNNSLPKIGPSKVSVPKFHFKVIYQERGAQKFMMAFLMEDTTPYADLNAYALSVDEIEEMVGWDFFSELDDDIEEDLERDVRLENWDFKARFQYLPCLNG
jgi:endonuclease G, mitochondrial